MDENQDVIGAVARLFRMMRRRPLKHEDLPHMSYRILWVLRHNDGIRASELVGQLEMRPASVTDALNRLERQGYLTRERDESDARAKRVFLTERARAEMDAQEKSRREENERLLKCLTEEEAAVFLSACGKLCAFLAQEDEEQDHHNREYHHRRGGRRHAHE